MIVRCCYAKINIKIYVGCVYFPFSILFCTTSRELLSFLAMLMKLGLKKDTFKIVLRVVLRIPFMHRFVLFILCANSVIYSFYYSIKLYTN